MGDLLECSPGVTRGELDAVVEDGGQSFSDARRGSGEPGPFEFATGDADDEAAQELCPDRCRRARGRGSAGGSPARCAARCDLVRNRG